MKYGWDSIKHEILFKNLSKEEARQKEVDLILQYDSTDPSKGYNNSTGGGGFSGIRLTPEQREHLSNVKKGNNPHIWTEEMRRKLSNSIKGHPSYTKGMKMSKESSLKKSQKLLGHPVSDENKRKYAKPVDQFDLNGNFLNQYYSQKEAARQTGINISSIHNCCEGKRKRASNYIFKYAKGDDTT